MRKDEFNYAGKEYGDAPQTGEWEDWNDSPIPADAEELNNVSEEPMAGNPKKRTSAHSRSRLVQTLSAIAVVATVVVMTAVLPANHVRADILKTVIANTSIAYEVFVEEGENLNLVLYNDFTHRQVTLKKGENCGQFTDLKEGMDYKLAVIGNFGFGEKTVIEKHVKTSNLPPFVTEWRGVETQCTCDVDGYFHFTMDFVDENGYWTEFTARLEDGDGNVSYCQFSENVLGDQKIDVALNAGLIGNTANFQITCCTSDPSATEEILVLYDEQVKI